MESIIAKLRYFPLDPVAGPPVPIGKADLDRIAREAGASISLQNVVAANRTVAGGIVREETMDSKIDEISQDIITVSADSESSFRSAIRSLIKLYRAPRTVYATWGSSEKGAAIVLELCDEDDGWY
jgi:hypothetical protein